MMTKHAQESDHRIREGDVSGLPFLAGMVLAISGLTTLVEGLYTISYWQGWLFLVLGVVVAVAAALLLFHMPGAPVAALVAALASLVVSAVWVATYHWFNLAAIGLDALAIYAIGRSKLRSWAGKDPLRT